MRFNDSYYSIDALLAKHALLFICSFCSMTNEFYRHNFLWTERHRTPSTIFIFLFYCSACGFNVARKIALISNAFTKTEMNFCVRSRVVVFFEHSFNGKDMCSSLEMLSLPLKWFLTSFWLKLLIGPKLLLFLLHQTPSTYHWYQTPSKYHSVYSTESTKYYEKTV